jgi:hypothetical protein
MALGANSYGDTTEIAALVPRHTDPGAELFTATTHPTLTQVETWTDQISAIVNSILAQNGFSTLPVTQADAKLMLDYFVNEEVAAICEGVNGSGRFGPTAKRGGSKGRFAVIIEDVQNFIEANAVGIERLGVPRPSDPFAGIAYRDTDEGGDDTAPIFQRGAFGNVFKDWDT